MKRYLTTGLTLLLFISGAMAYAQETDSPSSEWTIAVLSPGNHTAQPEAYRLTIDLLQTYLSTRVANLITVKELRPILRRYRIRSTGELSSHDAEILAANSNADIFLLTSIDFYRSGDNPEFGLSLRLVQPGEMRIISAVSHSSTGADHIGLFGVGRIEDVNILADKVVDEAVDDLIKKMEQHFKGSATSSAMPKVAVIQFDNLSKFRKAGSIISNWTITALVNRGYFVIEPGVVSEITALNGDLPVGGIDIPQLTKLTQKFKIDYVVTGQVDLLRMAQGRSVSSTPVCEFGARLIDAAGTQIKATFHCEANGNDGRTVFGLGRIHSVGSLLKKKLSGMVESFEDKEIRL